MIFSFAILISHSILVIQKQRLIWANNKKESIYWQLQTRQLFCLSCFPNRRNKSSKLNWTKISRHISLRRIDVILVWNSNYWKEKNICVNYVTNFTNLYKVFHGGFNIIDIYCCPHDRYSFIHAFISYGGFRYSQRTYDQYTVTSLRCMTLMPTPLNDILCGSRGSFRVT